MLKLSDELKRVLREEGPEDPTKEIPVIVTFIPGTDVAELEELGLKITRRYELLNAAAGLVSLRDMRRLSEVAQVEKIEYDSEIRIF